MTFYWSWLGVVVLLGSVASLVGAEPPSLRDRLAPLVKNHQGRVAYAIKHLGTGRGLSLNGDEVMPTASLIKIPILIEAYQQAQLGRIRLTDQLTMTEADKTPGSGILKKHFSPGVRLPIRDLLRLMIVYSDNTATNMVLDKIGIDAVNRRMSKLGLRNTRVTCKVFMAESCVDPEQTFLYGLGCSTPREMVALLEKMHRGTVVSAEACQAMCEHLKQCEDGDWFPRYLPRGVTVGHKTGSTPKVRTNGGLMYLPDGEVVALVVMTSDNADQSWKSSNAAQVLCGKIAKAVAEHYTAPRPISSRTVP